MKEIFSKMGKIRKKTIFNFCGVSFYFGNFNIGSQHEVKRLNSVVYYPLFLVFLIFRNSISKGYISKHPTPILGENGFIDNKNLFLNGTGKNFIDQEIFSPILNIVSKRNYFLLADYANTAFVEIETTNLKLLEYQEEIFCTYSHIYLKLLGVNRNNYQEVAKFIGDKKNVTLVDRYVPSINLVSKVTCVVTDDKLSSVTYNMINKNVELLVKNKNSVIIPKSAISLYENKLVPYDKYLLDNLLYSFLLTVPDQLIYNNIDHRKILDLVVYIEEKNDFSLLLLALIQFLVDSVEKNEKQFIHLYTEYLKGGELAEKLYIISEILIINCKLNVLNKVISISVNNYIRASTKENSNPEDFSQLFTAVKVVSRRLSGRIVNYDFINNIEINHLIELSGSNSGNIVTLLSILIENRNERLVGLLFDNLPFYSDEEIIKIHSKIETCFTNLGVLFDSYNKHWEKYLIKNFDCDKRNNLYINPYKNINERTNLDERNKVLSSEIKKLILLESTSLELLCNKEISPYQKFVLLLQSGKLNEATLANSIKGKRLFSLYSNLKSRADIVRHIATSYKILTVTEGSASKEDTIIIDISLGCMNSKTQFFSLLPWINDKSIQFTSLLNTFSIKTEGIDPHLDKINREFNADWLLQTSEYLNTLDIDLENKKVIYEGENYYHGFYEAAACTARTYDIDYNLNVNSKQCEVRLRRASILFAYLERVYLYAQRSKKRLIFVGGNSHLAPYSCIRDYILFKQSSHLNFVAIGAAYENYYSNFSTNYSKCFGIVNQSFNPKIRAAFLPEKTRFENWLEKNPENEEVINKVNSLIKVNRNFSDTPVCNELLNRIEKDKINGKKVVCCFGKIVFDSAVPYDGGPAHSGFKDWLNHTIEIAESSPDLLVLIKPHPHELKVEIAMKIGQYLRDLIPKSLPDNVIFLEHESFNTHEIAQLADLAVLWNGTSSMELTSLGVPVMMCGHFGLYDYHLDLIYPKDRNDYVLKLRDTQKIIIDEKLKYRAMAYVSYMGHHETAIPNQYARRQLLNDPVGIPIWYEDKLVNLTNLNDENMKYALDKILYNSVPCCEEYEN